MRWADAPLVAVDLEGSGGQDREREAILEIGIVPLKSGVPDMSSAWESTINPGRPIPRRPWISPGLADDALAGAPSFDQVRATIVGRLHGQVLIGHNIGVDTRLLQLRLPEIRPSALIDTARLYKHLHPTDRHWNLIHTLEKYGLNQQVSKLAPHGRPHRALWDATATALLLSTLVRVLPAGDDTTLAELEHPPAIDQAALF